MQQIVNFCSKYSFSWLNDWRGTFYYWVRSRTWGNSLSEVPLVQFVSARRAGWSPCLCWGSCRSCPDSQLPGLWGLDVLGLLCTTERGQRTQNMKASVWEASLWFPSQSACVLKCRGPHRCVLCWDQTSESLQSFLWPERNDLKRWLDSLGDKNAIFIRRVGRAREKGAKCWERAVAVLLRALCAAAGDGKGFGVRSCPSLPPLQDPWT